MLVVQEVWVQEDTRGCGGKVPGDDQELAAPPSMTMPVSWPCRHRHQDDVLNLGSKNENCPCHLVPNSKSYNFVVMSLCWFATWVKGKFHQTLLAEKGKGVLGIKIKW